MMAPPPAVVAVSVRFHHWRLGFRQSSFHHIARVLQGATLHAFRWPLLLRHALVPSGFRLQVNRMTQKSPFELLLTASGIQHRVPRRTLLPHTAMDKKFKALLPPPRWSSPLHGRARYGPARAGARRRRSVLGGTGGAMDTGVQHASGARHVCGTHVASKTPVTVWA